MQRMSSVTISDFCLLVFVIFISLFVFVYFFSCFVCIKTYDTFLRSIIAITFLRSVDVTLRYGWITELTIHKLIISYGTNQAFCLLMTF